MTASQVLLRFLAASQIGFVWRRVAPRMPNEPSPKIRHSTQTNGSDFTSPDDGLAPTPPSRKWLRFAALKYQPHRRIAFPNGFVSQNPHAHASMSHYATISTQAVLNSGAAHG